MRGIVRAFRRFLRRRSAPAQIVVYTRKGCHLCEELARLLDRMAGEFEFSLRYVDVDQHPELAREYGDRVPVVVVEGRVRHWGKVPEAWLKRTLRRTAPRKRSA